MVDGVLAAKGCSAKSLEGDGEVNVIIFHMAVNNSEN
jgi:hypothetical protein